MIAYRLAKSKYVEDLSGTGAAMYGGRWNSIGTYILYTSETSALSILENIVHYDVNEIPDNLNLARIIIPENSAVLKLESKHLPKNWNSPVLFKELQLFGDKLIKDKKYLAIRIPSVIAPYENNLLINPHHGQFSKLKIDSVIPLSIDIRLKSKI